MYWICVIMKRVSCVLWFNDNDWKSRHKMMRVLLLHFPVIWKWILTRNNCEIIHLHSAFNIVNAKVSNFNILFRTMNIIFYTYCDYLMWKKMLFYWIQICITFKRKLFILDGNSDRLFNIKWNRMFAFDFHIASKIQNFYIKKHWITHLSKFLIGHAFVSILNL